MKKTLLICAVLALVLAGCYGAPQAEEQTEEPAAPAATEPAAGEPIKIGWIGPLTGEAVVYGEPMENVTKLAIEEINAAGGINGQPLEVVYEDGKCAGEESATAMQKLASVDQVKAVVGGFCSSETLAAEPIATENKIFLISGSASNPSLTGVSKYFARTYPSDTSQGKVLADLAYNKNDWKKVAVIIEQLDYPLGLYTYFKESFEALGGTTVKEEFASDLSDYRTILTKLKAQEVDALFVDVQTPVTAERIFKQMQELDWHPGLLTSDVIPGDPETVANNAEFLEGSLGAEFGVDLENEKFQHLAKTYEEKFGVEMPYQGYAQTVYDAIHMLSDAMVEVGTDSDKIADWFRSGEEWQGASGVVKIKEDGDRAGGHVGKIIRDGKTQIFTE